MGTIRGEYLEEAVSWDGSERKRIRQIRRMTVSFGAVAASVAVVIGMIAFKARQEHIQTADSGLQSSSITEDNAQKINLYGGHGELHQISGRNGTICYDNDYIYEWGDKWLVNSGGKTIRAGENEWPSGLEMDGKNLFRLHDGKIFETDSFGNETELMNLADYPFPAGTAVDEIHYVQRLSDRMLALQYYQDYGQDCRILIADLQEKKIAEQDASCYRLFPDSETSYYAFSTEEGALVRFTLQNGSLERTAVWSSGDKHYEYSEVVMQEHKLYITAKECDYETDNAADFPVQYIIVDLDAGTAANTVCGMNENLYAGTALIRMVSGDDSFAVYRSTLDRKNEELLFAVPYTQYFDTDTYGKPGMRWFHSVYESDDMVIVYLPTVAGDDTVQPTLHGEEAVKIDLRTGKVLYYGTDYNMDSAAAQEHAASAVTDASAIMTEAAVQATAAPAAVTSAGAAGTTTAFTTTEAQSDEQRKAFAEDMINEYCNAYEGYAFGGLQEVDKNDIKEVDLGDEISPYRYQRVTSMNSIAEVKQKIAETVTGQEYDNLIGIIYGAEGSDFGTPVYQEIDGKLYMLEFGKSSRFQEWLWDSLTIVRETENGFTASMKHKSYGRYIDIYYFEFVDLKDGSANSYRISHVIYESTDEKVP